MGAGLDEAIDVSLDADFQAESGMSAVMNETRRAQDFLRTMSSETGGFAVVNQNDLNDAFGKIIQENSSYYLLGYYPTNDKRDGKFRKVLVRVKRPGLQVKYRQGYTAPKGKPATRETTPTAKAAPPDLRAALESPLPVSGSACGCSPRRSRVRQEKPVRSRSSWSSSPRVYASSPSTKVLTPKTSSSSFFR